MKSPLEEPAVEPAGLEAFYDDEPEGWSDATLTAAVVLQRAERERRMAARRRKKASKDE